MIKRSALTFIFSAAMVLGLGATAGAQTDCSASPLPDNCNGTGVLPSNPDTAAPTPVAAPAGPTVVVNKQTLPVTGSETTALALGGIVLVAAGGALVWRSNRAAA